MPSLQPPVRAAEHIVLLGDSIFANVAYTGGEPDVAAHLRTLLPAGWTATLAARDGATTADMGRQLREVPRDATWLVVSVGGNDAIGNIGLLSMRASSSAEVLGAFATRLAAFESDYRTAIDQAIRLGRPVTLCTIYNGALPGKEGHLARIALMMFNDVILRTAFGRRLAAIDLRAICHEPGDYANPIEPSGQGGLKIARAIAIALGAVDGAAKPSRVWA